MEDQTRTAARQEQKKRILFVCTHNSSRSQMAEGLLRSFKGDRYEVFSAGTEPTGVHPGAAAVMAEIGIDISAQRSKGLGEFQGMGFDEVVTVCDHARESCPVFLGGGLKRHQGFEDPSATTGTEAEVLEAFRRVREEIRAWIGETYGYKEKTEKKGLHIAPASPKKRRTAMEIKILGPGCVNCQKVEALVRETVAEAGVAAEIEKVSDIMQIAKYGVFGTPAVVVDGKVKSVGKIPKKEEILAWLGKKGQ